MFRLVLLALLIIIGPGGLTSPSFAQQSLQQLQEADEARRRAATKKRIEEEAKRVEERRKAREAERAQRFGIAVPAPAAEPDAAPVQKQRRRSRRR